MGSEELVKYGKSRDFEIKAEIDPEGRLNFHASRFFPASPCCP